MKRTAKYILLSVLPVLAASCTVVLDDTDGMDKGSSVSFSSGQSGITLSDISLLLFDNDGIYLGSVAHRHTGTVGDYIRRIDPQGSARCLSLLNMEGNYVFDQEPIAGVTTLQEISLSKCEYSTESTVPMLGMIRSSEKMRIPVSPIVEVKILIGNWELVEVNVEY